MSVPNVPGVPPLSSYGASLVALLVSDLIGFILGPPGSLWGIFLDGESVLPDADSTVSFDYREDNPISTYPVEDGGFQSYDKVKLPPEIRVRVSCGGSVAKRQAFLQSLDAVMNTTDLYDVVTPEKVYTDYNFTHRDLKRNGHEHVGMIVVDLWLVNVPVTTRSTFSNTASPTAAGQQSLGNVQAQTPSSDIRLGAPDGTWRVQ